jgi:hypothetical protein
MSTLTLTQQVVVLVLSGGGAAAIFTLVKAYLAVRESTDTREASAIGNLERWRKEADDRATHAYVLLGHEREVSAYWQRRSGFAEHLLARNGVPAPSYDPPPDSPPPPTAGATP